MSYSIIQILRGIKSDGLSLAEAHELIRERMITDLHQAQVSYLDTDTEMRTYVNGWNDHSDAVKRIIDNLDPL